MAGREQLEEIRRRKEHLSDQLAISREAIGMSRDLVKQNLDIKRKISRTLQRNQSKVVISTAVVGFLASTLLRKKKPKNEKEKKGVSGWLKGLIVGAIVKKARTMAIERVKLLIIRKIQNRQQQ